MASDLVPGLILGGLAILVAIPPTVVAIYHLYQRHRPPVSPTDLEANRSESTRQAVVHRSTSDIDVETHRELVRPPAAYRPRSYDQENEMASLVILTELPDNTGLHAA